MSEFTARSRTVDCRNDGARRRGLARAKINLTLHVKGKRPDGYHELESLVVFADVCDELSFAPALEDSLTIEGPFANALEGENLIFKAKRAVASWLGQDIAGAFRLEKHIPVAAGLGGGSSDAAAAVRLLLDFHAEAARDTVAPSRCAEIGADVPVCFYHRAAWMRGLGERVTPAEGLIPLPAVLVNPRIKLSTAEVFKKLSAARFLPGDETAEPPFPTDWDDPETAATALLGHRNDLEAPAIALEPAVDTVLETLRTLEGCLLARLSGSGPTCFGLFRSVALAAQAASDLAKARPGWWVVPTVLS